MAKPPKQRGKNVTVVTPRMLQAGAIALATLSGDASDYERVSTVYRAMAAVAPQTRSIESRPPDNFLEVLRIMSASRRSG
jgi:hypothetical protein